MTSKCCRDKAVLVAVYTERPRRRLPSSKDRQIVHHYHHIHKNASENDGRRRGYNRKAELLDHARYLRASAQPADASAAVPSSQLSSHIKPLPSVQIVAPKSKTKHGSSPACFSNWEFFIPSFLRSMTILKTTKGKGKNKRKNSVSTTSKMKNLLKSLRVQKNGSFLSKMLRAVQKRH